MTDMKTEYLNKAIYHLHVDQLFTMERHAADELAALESRNADLLAALEITLERYLAVMHNNYDGCHTDWSEDGDETTLVARAAIERAKP